MSIKKACLLLLGLLSLTVVSMAQDSVTIAYWHTYSDAETAQLDKVIAKFEEANPGITIEPTRYAYSDYKQAILTSIAGGEAPDTLRMDIVWVPQFAQQGALLQLDSAMPDFQTIADSVFPGPLATAHWDGKYWGLPLNTNTQVLLYNKAEFEAAGIDAPPATIEDFVADACALTSSTDQYGYAMGGTYFWAPAPLFYAMGGKIVDEKVTTADGYINGADSVAAFQTLVDLYSNGCISPNVLGGGVGTAEGHATGLYSMIIDGPWMVDIYKNDFPDFEVNFAPIPAGKNGSSSVVGGEDIVVSATTEHQSEALAWVNYMMSEEAQLTMAEVGVIPTLQSLTGNEALPDYFNVFMTQLETAQARVAHPKWDDIDGAINAAFTKALKGDATVQDALDEAATTIDGLLTAK